MRAISLASRTGYTIDNELINAITANAFLIDRCPAEAVRAEFNKILMSRKPSRYLRLLNKTGLLEHVAPELYKCVGVKQDDKYHKYDVFTHLIYTTDNCGLDLTIRLAGLLHDVGKPDTRREHKEGKRVKVTFHKHEMSSVKLARDFLRRLKYDINTARKVLSLVKLHMYHFTREWTDSAIRKFIRRALITEEFMTEENIGNFPLFRLRAAERLGNGLKGVAVTDRQRDFEKKLIRVYQESTGLDIQDLEINGDAIMDTFRLQPGERIGGILKFLLDQVLEEPKLNNKLDLLKLTTEYLYKESINDSRKYLGRQKSGRNRGRVAGRDTR